MRLAFYAFHGYYYKEMENNEIQRLFKLHYAKMYQVARSILCDEQESEDVVSDIFENLLHGQTVLMPDTEERYLLTSVRNQCYKRLRHISSPLGDDGFTEPMDENEDENERLTDINEFVTNHLSSQEQRIFHLRFNDGCSYEEIAVAESISRVAVWKHLSHALNQIRQQFASIVGVIMVSGIALAAIHIVRHHVGGDSKTPPQEMRTPDSSQQPLPSDTAQTDTIQAKPHIFDNVPLDTLLHELADYYHISVVFQREESRQLRLHFEWKHSESLGQVIERLNSFEAVSIVRKSEKLIVE